MFGSAHSQPLRLAIACETPATLLSKLLQLQRAEEPETPVALSEVSPTELAAGMEERRFDAGLTLAPMQESPLQAEALWRDDLAIALPLRSPLLAHPRVPLEVLAEYPLVMWCSGAREAINPQVHELLDGLKTPIEVVQYVRSFELMAVLVAAGYGVGFSGRSHLAASRALNIVMRPFAAAPRTLTTYLVYPDAHKSPPLDRFAGRAASVQ
ncbi:LysR family substrate-binding domain-containing protein [Burkholderia multivorans]|uniref:LysR family substrate-binding domain-containing protein n=1 Tax=Burkholderia multivorans TaxID=87883 RepID=UPI00158BDE97|nr:LysR family substrate-binding domain-containing protein [Burkholderia multivorans]